MFTYEKPLTVVGCLWLLATAASCASYELWPKTDEFIDRLECGMSEEDVARVVAEYPGLELRDLRDDDPPWDKVAYKPQTSIALDFEAGGLRRADVSWVDAILHSKTLPVRDFCSPEGR